MDALRQSIEKVGGDIRRVGSGYEIVNATPNRLDEQRLAQIRAANASVTIVPMRVARASVVADLLRAIYPAPQQITVDETNNIIIINGPAQQRAQIATTAEVLDVEGVSSRTVAIYPVGQGNANELADKLTRAYAALPGSRTSPVEFIPVQRTSSLLVIARQQSALGRVSQLLAGLDRQRSTARRMYVVTLQHARAPILAGVLRESLGMANVPAGATPGATPSSGQPATMSISPSAVPQPPAPPGAPTAGAAPGAPTEGAATPWDLENVPLRIVANADTNALVIFATASEYAVLTEAIRRLDATPLQVLIEATIMDVTLNDQLQFGVQAFLQQGVGASGLIQAGTTASSFAGMGAASSGFNFVFSSAGQVQAAINALRSVTKVQVLSSPQVVTQDNQRARLEVGSQVPITTQQVTQTTVSSPAVVNSISYVQTGVILNVTPRVNTTGGVDLDIKQEITDAPTIDPNNPSLTPVLNRRMIETRAAVQSTQTIALGGLITESTGDSRSRVPLLGDIPVVGWLFGQTANRRTKQELLIFLTPTVFTNPEEGRAFSLDLRRRLDSLWKKEGSSSRRP